MSRWEKTFSVLAPLMPVILLMQGYFTREYPVELDQNYVENSSIPVIT